MNVIGKLRHTFAGITVSGALVWLKNKGLRYAFHKTWLLMFGNSRYGRSAGRRLFSGAELRRQRRDSDRFGAKLSLLCVLDSPEEKSLKAMLDSLKAQTNPGWELCCADASGQCEAVIRRLADGDERVKNIFCGSAGEALSAALRQAEGEYIAVIGQEDSFHPAALYEVMRTASAEKPGIIYTDEVFPDRVCLGAYESHFKPDYAPDTLLGSGYIDRFAAIRRELAEKVGGFRQEYGSQQEYDLMLRAADKAGCVAHIPEALYYHRGGQRTDMAAMKRAAEDFLRSKGLSPSVDTADETFGTLRIGWELVSHPKVSILIPNYEQLACLRRCIDSILTKSTYDNYEIVIIENNSTSPELFAYYDELMREHDNIKVAAWSGKFNYSAINNYGVGFCSGEVLLLLNNDTEVISSDWLEQMLMYAQRQDVGIVGAKLRYTDGRIQHGGVLFGCGGVAGHYFYRADKDEKGYMGRLTYAQDMTAVTAACVMLRHQVWEEIGGLDEQLAVCFNDVDLCLKIREKGYLAVWTPFAQLYHHESISRGTDQSPENQARFLAEIQFFRDRWIRALDAGDPYYNPNFSMDVTDCRLKRKVTRQEPRYTRKLISAYLANSK